MSEEEKKDYVYKMNVPIFNNLELKELDYKIENYLDDIVSEISKTVSRDRDIIILQKVIEKQQKEIEELKEDISNMYDEKVIRNILEDDCGLSKYEIDEILN